MPKRVSSNIAALIFGILLVCFLAAFYISAAWQGPTLTPPDGNVDMPLNVGTTTQTKEGPLALNALGSSPTGLIVNQDAIFLNGNVGIGTTTPSGRLDIVGGPLALGGQVGAAGQVLTSQGAGANPVWAGAVGVPTGTVLPYTTSVAPAGYLIADGSAVSRTTYATLFATIGTTFGAGDGSTTFNLPNMKGRVPVGLDSTLTDFDVLGRKAGTSTHTLTIAEMPSHTHGIAGLEQQGDGAGLGYHWPEADTYRVSTATGGGGAHNNLQPYIVLYYIIKF